MTLALTLLLYLAQVSQSPAPNSVQIHRPAVQRPGFPSVDFRAVYVDVESLRINSEDRPDERLYPVAWTEFVDGQGCTHTWLRYGGKNHPERMCPV